MKSESAIGQHLIANPECAKTYTDDNFRIIGQARSSFHLGVLESVYIRTQNPVLCKQKEFIFHLDSSSISNKMILFIISRVPASGYIFRFTFRSLSDVSFSDECRTKKAFSMLKQWSRFFVL